VKGPVAAGARVPTNHTSPDEYSASTRSTRLPPASFGATDARTVMMPDPAVPVPAERVEQQSVDPTRSV